MIVLKITEDIRQELTTNTIVICTYDKNSIEFDAIGYEYKQQYPLLVEEEVSIPNIV